MMPPEPSRNQHKSPDGHNREEEKGAAHRRTARPDADATPRKARSIESAVATSRTVRASARDDEHSARCVARSAAPGVTGSTPAAGRGAPGPQRPAPKGPARETTGLQPNRHGNDR